MRVIVWAALCYVLAEIRSTLPRTEAEAAGFVQGLAWGLLTFVVMLVVSSYCAATYLGVPL